MADIDAGKHGELQKLVNDFVAKWSYDDWVDDETNEDSRRECAAELSCLLKKGQLEYTREDGLVDGGRIVKLVEVDSRTEPNIEECPDEVVVLLDRMGSDKLGNVKRYVIAIAEVD